MTKKQKIWLGVFLAMFIIPEILWSPVLGIFPFGQKFLLNNDNHGLITFILFMETLSLFAILMLLSKLKKSILIIILTILVAIFLVRSFYISYLLFATF